MSRHKVITSFDTNIDGVVTSLSQNLDLSKMQDARYSRILNAAKRGYITAASGIASVAVKAAASHANTPALPFIMKDQYSIVIKSPYMWARWEKPLTQLAELSAVRWKFMRASRDIKPWDRDREHAVAVDHRSSVFYGWDGPKDFKEFVKHWGLALKNVPELQASRERIVQTIEARGTLTLSKEVFLGEGDRFPKRASSYSIYSEPSRLYPVPRF